MKLPNDTVPHVTDMIPFFSRQVEDSQCSSELNVTVVICAYTEARWHHTEAAVRSVLSQQRRPQQVLLVIDHNAALAARARQEFPALTVLDSNGEPGLSGARNTGLRAATCGVTAFLDDDVRPYEDSHVVATGGSVYPLWLAGRPRWMPPEFYWVVGCSYRGLPEEIGVVRNPIGANMSMRTAQALGIGGFYAEVGRTASKPRGCEETELAIRLTASRPGSAVVYVPAAAVDHYVGRERVTFSYFLRRCWHEGRSKATVVRLAGARAGLERERRHAAAVIPAAIFRYLRQLATGDASATMRIVATVVGLAVTVGGYLTASAHLSVSREH